MTKEVSQIVTCETPHKVWTILEQTNAPSSQARTVNTRIAVMDLRSMGIAVFSGEVIPLCRRLGSRVAALGA